MYIHICVYSQKSRDLKLTKANKLDNRPSLQDVNNAFKLTKLIAYAGSISLTCILIILWPAVMSAVGVMELYHFTQWVSILDGYIRDDSISLQCKFYHGT